MLLTAKLRVKDKHASELRRQAGVANFVWNYCNETSHKAWTRDHKWMSSFDLQKLVAGSGKYLGVLTSLAESVCSEHSKKRNKAKKCLLRWRGRKSLGWVPFRGKSIFSRDGKFFMGGIGFETMHDHPYITSGCKFRDSSFNEDAKGRWYINLIVDVETYDRKSTESVGVDLGLKDLATLSNGQVIPAMKFYRKSESALATAQKARKSKRVRSIHAKAANRRKDFLHKASAGIASSFGIIVVGDVSSRKLARTKMAKSVFDAGWFSFKNMLSYKALMHGGRFIEVNEAMTSQICSSCGSLPPSRPKGIAGLGIREWRCDDCGVVHDRDVNAARNILRIGLDTLTEGAVS